MALKTGAIQSPIVPPGLKALIQTCQSIYPDQTNPLQVTTVLKYWLGGQDPLDYISMYYNKGDEESFIPPHWHYISFGLSDLHGDGRVHIAESGINGDIPRSGMGFELTFRLIIKKDNNQPYNQQTDRPPTWPANLLQALARYCFQTGNRLCPGDNVPWRKALDGSSNSQLQHLLIADDAQLGTTDTPFGTVQFCQIVGVPEMEMEQASRWNGKGVLNLLKRDITTGGEWLITDMDRCQSVFELFPETLLQLQDDLEKEGSDLAGVNAEFTFKELYKQNFKTEIDSESLNQQWLLDEKNKNQENSLDIKDKNSMNSSSNFLQTMSISNSLQESCPINFQPIPADLNPLEGIEITMAPYAAKFLLLAIKDRVRHGRHFTFKAENLAMTFVAESVTGCAVNKSNPYGVIGYWIQIMITDDLIPRMMETFTADGNMDKITERKEFEWPDKNLKIIIDNPVLSINFKNLP